MNRTYRDLSHDEQDTIVELKKRRIPTRGFCTVVERVPLGSTDGKGPWNGNPDRWAEPGTTLQIVMVSRMGDFGLTDDLKRDFGYDVRLDFEDAAIKDIRLAP